jgi:hypothetical protein
MQGESVCVGEAPCPRQIVQRQYLSTLGVFQAQQPGARVVKIVGLDDAGDLIQIQAAVALEIQRLWLNAAEDGAAAALRAVTVGKLSCYVLVAALAVAQQGEEISLGAAGDEQRRLMTEHLGGQVLQPVGGRILSVDVVTDFRLGHGLAHGRRRPGHCVAA